MEFNLINRSDIKEQDKPVIMLVMMNIMTIIQNYNRFVDAQKENDIPFPKIHLEFKFINNKLIILFNGKHTDTSIDNWIKINNNLTTYKELLEEYKNKIVNLISDLEAYKDYIEKEKENIRNEKEKIDVEWQNLRSIQYKPEKTKRMSEDEIRKKIEEELYEENEDYLDMLPS